MRALAAVLCFAAVAFATTEWTQFEAFMSTYQKTYADEAEKLYRFSVFQHNLVMAEKFNEDHVAIGGERVFGVNSLSDMTREEFISTRLMTKMPPREPQIDNAVVSNVGLPDSVDWRSMNSKNYVTPVKDQGNCGSCWAHSADEAEESFDMIYNNRSTAMVLSVQQCTACTYNYDGCNGGWPHDAYLDAIEKRNGIDLDSDYPYSIPTAGNCKFGNGNADKPVTLNKNYNSPARGQLQTLLANTGPVSVCVAAESWQSYSGGILKSCSGSVDHCVQAVGYNIPTTESYWIVRNSWGTGWGIKGYIYLDMTADNGDICHIQEYMTYPFW
jgi:C1A family cysteine protease